MLPHLLELLRRDSESVHPSLSKLELDWSNQPQLKILHVETEDQGYSVLQLRPGTAKQIKYFLKESSKSSEKCIFLWKRKHKRMLQLHNNNKIMSFPIYENICFLKIISLFPSEKSSVGELYSKSVDSSSLLTAFPTASRRGWDAHTPISHTGVFTFTATGPERYVLRFGPLRNCFLFPSLA